MKKKMYFSLPIQVHELDSNLAFNDDTLIPVDLKIMHDGLNINDSTFYEEAIEDAKPSLKNKPIMGYIRSGDGEDSSDFSGHEVEVLMTEDGLKYNYLERPLGVVPEQNSYSIMQEEDGTKYVCCRGYLWKEYLNAGYDILRKKPQKSVSMEIVVDDYSFNDDDSMNILKYRYLGITILGDDIMPGMQGAVMNVVGQFDNNNNSLYQKIEDLNEKIESHFALENIVLEGGEKVETDKTFTEESEAVENPEDLEEIEVTEETEELEEPEEDFELKYIELLDDFNKLKGEVEELKEFKTTRLQEDLELEIAEAREEKIEYIRENYVDLKEDVKDMFISKIDEYESIEDIDSDICVYIVKNKLAFSKTKKESESVKVGVGVLDDKKSRIQSPYGNIFNI